MITPDEVTAVIVTRGDVDLTPVVDSLIFNDVVVWDNACGPRRRRRNGWWEVGTTPWEQPEDLGAYGRYAAIQQYNTERLIYVQDDDCIVSAEDQQRLLDSYEPGMLSALMPAERTDYKDTVLIGWGALFDFDLPRQAFIKWLDAGHMVGSREFRIVGADFVFPILTPWKRLDAEHIDLPHAHADNRTWGSFRNYRQVKDAFLHEARKIRDGRS